MWFVYLFVCLSVFALSFHSKTTPAPLVTAYTFKHFCTVSALDTCTVNINHPDLGLERWLQVSTAGCPSWLWPVCLYQEEEPSPSHSSRSWGRLSHRHLATHGGGYNRHLPCSLKQQKGHWQSTVGDPDGNGFQTSCREQFTSTIHSTTHSAQNLYHK